MPRHIREIQKTFPIKDNCIYLNNASIGPCSTDVTSAVNTFMTDVQKHGRLNYSNWCQQADEVIKPRIARLLGGKASEIAFVPNTTQGLSLVANGLDWRPGDNVIISSIEYPSNVYPWLNLQPRGVEVQSVEPRNGGICLDDLVNLMNSRTRLVSISSVQFSNGYRVDLEQLSDICRRRNVLLNIDAIQHIGALDFDVSQYAIDFLSAGGHKWLLSPIGTGIFYCRESSLNYLRPPTVGYHTVDKPLDHADFSLDWRPGAARFEEALVNFPGLWGLNASIEIFLELGMSSIETHILELTSLAIERLSAKGYLIRSSIKPSERSGIVTFQHPTISASEIDSRLQQAGIQLGVRRGALRISPSLYNDADEITAFLSALP